MSRLFKNKYRVASARLQTWDYGWNAAYYVTICTRNRICHFGNVVDGIMQLSDIGIHADDCWLAIPVHFPFVKLGNHIVMPNHVHGIVVIDKHDDNNAGLWGVDGGGDFYDDGDGDDVDWHGDADGNVDGHDNGRDGDAGVDGVETQDFASLRTKPPTPPIKPPMPIPRFPHPSMPQNDDTPKNKFGPQSQNLASIIRGFKTGVTINARTINPDFKWQTRYHERIIRDEEAFLTISKYISDNPRNWRDDEFFK
jgi:REP element-mobilizing transposase RayT